MRYFIYVQIKYFKNNQFMKNLKLFKTYLSLIPPVHKILNFPEVQKLIDQYGQLVVVSSIRSILADYRNKIKYETRINEEFSVEEIIKLLKKI
ncbi:MAG: hypothetical protein CM15mP109_14650 [Candidatus Dadabacteria bacterium]|nr:MAG: hypothetical protein CM15mP109_14650 [Candidatus Dadabacteria bacterium]